MSRQEILEKLANLISSVEYSHPVRVAIDGVDAAGKTALAEELSPFIESRGRPIIRASVDGFHNPRNVRYQQGVDSPVGYYQDSFNHEAIQKDLLIPLGPGGNRNYRLAVFDFKVDALIHEPARVAPSDAVLLFDGVFLLRPELKNHWDFSIFVDVDFEVSVPRAVARDVARSDGQLDWITTLAKYNLRYVPGQKIYFEEAQPQVFADVILVNNDFLNPSLVVK